MTWNVLEAAARLGIKRVVHGLQHPGQPHHHAAHTHSSIEYLPVDEDHPVSPQEDYGM